MTQDGNTMAHIQFSLPHDEVETLRTLLRHIEAVVDKEDIQLVVEYMQGCRALGTTPGKVGERGLSYAEKLVYASYPEKTELIRAQMALHIATEAARTQALLLSQRKPEKTSHTL